jgi:hypothetical protein
VAGDRCMPQRRRRVLIRTLLSIAAKRGRHWALFLAFGWLLSVQASAQSTDSVLLSVSPGDVQYSVQITSVSGAGYDFGSLDLGATTVSTTAIGVKNDGNVSEYFSISVGNSNPDGWTAISSGTPQHDQFLLLGRLAAGGSSQPSPSAFNVNTDTVTAVTPNYAAGRYGQAARTDPGANIDLWLKLTMPSTVETTAPQTMRLYVNGQAQ